MDVNHAERLIGSSISLQQNKKNDGVSIDCFANLDFERSSRTGFPEAVFAEDKTPEQVAAILDAMAQNLNEKLQLEEGDDASSPPSLANHAILATRVSPDLYQQVRDIPLQHGKTEYHEMARIVSMKASSLSAPTRMSNTDGNEQSGKVVVATAGTTDLPVAEEAAVVLEEAGCEVDRVFDVGVAGLHRIINALPRLHDPQVRCIIVAAGMDGALPSVVGGLVRVPVIAVPTSVGYGVSLGGLAALGTMLSSCAPGVAVVNIDNGFGAAALAFKCIHNR